MAKGTGQKEPCVVGKGGMNIIQRNIHVNENIWLDRESNSDASLVRFFTTELSEPISTVHLVQTTTFLPPYKVHAQDLQQTQVYPVRTY